MRQQAFRWATTTLVILGASLGAAGCGGGGLDSEHIDPPLVKQFSPTLSPIDLNTRLQNPTFTDGGLTNSTHPSYPGEIVIFFNETVIDPASVYTGGDRNLGPDPSSLQILRFIPGTGNVILPLADVLVEADRIRCYPAALWLRDVGTGTLSPIFGGLLPDGQYSIGVFENIRNIHGKNMIEAPVFHSFTVGEADVVAPFVVATDPVNDEPDVGAGAPPPTVFDTGNLADVRTNIFGPTSPDIIVRFNEGISSASVTVGNFQVVDAGAFIPGGGAPPQIAPAPGFPKLKSILEQSTLPSNGHEIVWRPDPKFGGYPFGTTIKSTIIGSDGGANGSPIRDLALNGMENSYVFSFRTLQPPNFPQNPFPEYAVWWSATDRVGVIDEINQQGLADAFMLVPGATPVARNVKPLYSDTITTEANIPGFDPTEISMDARTHPTTCHSWVYVISPSSSEVVIVNTRTSMPVAIIKTPTPGGVANCTGPENAGSSSQAPNVLLVTNSSANTYTVFDIKNVVPGTEFLNGPIRVTKTVNTGNTPRAIAISTPSDLNFHRDGNPPPPNGAGAPGPKPELIMYADFTDGVVNVTTLSKNVPVRSFSLGQKSAPNDVAMSPCLGLLFGAISQGGDGPNKGKVAYYVSGPGCLTGTSTPGGPDNIVGDLSDFDGPSGLVDSYLPPNDPIFFIVAESGSQKNAVTTLGLEVGAINFPRIITRFQQVGANPTNVTQSDGYIATPCITFINDPFPVCLPTHPFCWYNGTRQKIYQTIIPFGGHWDDPIYARSQNIYVCARGSGQVIALDALSGARDFYSPITIPGVRFVATHVTQ